MAKEKLSRSRELASKVIFAALQILSEKGGQAPGKEVILEVEKRVNLDDWAKAIYEKSGYVRWQSMLHFYSIDCIKAGYLVKKKGVWYLTPEGENALKLGEIDLLNAATSAYKKWKNENQPSEVIKGQDVTEEGQQGQEATIQEVEQLAIEGLKKHIQQKIPTSFRTWLLLCSVGWDITRLSSHPKGKMVELM
ncbi:winged helix-turn-helix domain-containing protein [Nitrosomonas communis]|uniref:Restriction system protein n=1 Tax=Nitrosomonas communis TaxID=44574 RepID=A0A1I4SJ42_9PROT|nr:winged helix-turn-helix domain-containing protein [Nitrosomonas communis]SFM64293.1 restriction system protein [Nitrosomonas communis]